MNAPAMTAHAADEPRRPRTRRPDPGSRVPASESVFAAFLADPRLTNFEKVLLAILADYCRAPWNAFAFPSTAELARRLGVHLVVDGGEARVNRALARMERLGLLSRIAWYEIGDFMESIGGPRLGLADPRQKGVATRRYILLWWKVPGLSDGYSVALRGRVQAGATTRVYGRVPGAGVTRDMTQAPAGDMTQAPAIRTSSNSELLNSNEGVNVDAARARGGPGQPGPEVVAVAGPIPPPEAGPTRPAAETDPGPAAPTDPAGPLSPLDRERAARTILRECDSRRWTIGPDGSLEVMERFRGLVDPPEEKHREALRKFLPEVLAIKFPGSAGAAAGGPAQAGPAPSASSTTVDLLRRLASPCGPEAVEAAAVKLAAHLDDRHSLGYHRKRLAEVRDGTLSLKKVLSALKSSGGAGVADPRRVYANLIEAGRERA